MEQQRKVKRGEIYYYDFGKQEGSIQQGERPVMVIQDDILNEKSPTTIVAAISSVKKKIFPFHVLLDSRCGLKYPSVVMLEQVKTVNRNELKDYIGKVDDHYILNQIAKATKKTFGLWYYKPKRKGEVRCLCPKCLRDYKNNPDYIVTRVSHFQKVKDRCEKCPGFGYDYLIMDKVKISGEKRNVYEKN